MRLFIALACALLLASCRSGSTATTAQQPQQRGTVATAQGEVSASTLIIFFDPQAGDKPLLKAVADYGATVIYRYNTMSGMAIALPQGAPLDKAKAHFEQVQGVLGVSYDHKVQLH